MISRSAGRVAYAALTSCNQQAVEPSFGLSPFTPPVLRVRATSGTRRGRTADDIDAVKGGRYTVGGNAGVVVLGAEAEAHTTYASNASMFVLSREGLMINVSINGQQLKYQSFSA
jgi:hypothetical protein